MKGKSFVLVFIWSFVWIMFCSYCGNVLFEDWFGEMWTFKWWSIGIFLFAGFIWVAITALLLPNKMTDEQKI